MIKIIFKEVGQGDTIVLEYEYESSKRVGILDCKKSSLGNPALEYLVQNDLKEIYFIVLSHPHLDHLSGMFDLLDYCIKNNIAIRYFLHTGERVPEYLETAGNGNIELEDLLINLYLKVEELSKMGTTITTLRAFDGDDELNKGKDFFPLNTKLNIYFKVLAPRMHEYNKYSSKIRYKWDEEDKNGNADANWLATTLKIGIGSQYIMLTSDTSKQVFFDLLKEETAKKRNDFDGNLALCQIPHHGSHRNFYKGFWKKIKGKDSKAVFSVGENNYKHPSLKVKESLIALRYDIYSTGQVGSLREESSVLESYSTSLDTFSYAISTGKNGKFNGDQAFIITNDGCLVA